jgi:hypothetical protein
MLLLPSTATPGSLRAWIGRYLIAAGMLGGVGVVSMIDSGYLASGEHAGPLLATTVLIAGLYSSLVGASGYLAMQGHPAWFPLAGLLQALQVLSGAAGQLGLVLTDGVHLGICISEEAVDWHWGLTARVVIGGLGSPGFLCVNFVPVVLIALMIHQDRASLAGSLQLRS